jgi:hypothetical protein
MADRQAQHEPTGGYRPQDTGATAPPLVRNQPSSVRSAADETDRLRRIAGTWVNAAAEARQEVARLREALRQIADQGAMPNGSDVFNGAQHREAVMIARRALAT